MPDLRLSTDFETGSGTLQQLAPGHWRLDTVADEFGYNRYFCLRVANHSSQGQTLRLEVHPDPRFGERSHFMTHFPSHIWYGYADGSRWMPLRHTWEGAVRFHETFLELRVPLEAGQELLIASNVPLPYSSLISWSERLQQRHGEKLSLETLGDSFEKRPVPLLRLGQAAKPKLLVLAGMHSSEHSGVFAAQGIVEYLLSAIAPARRIAGEFDVAVVPMLNPDGNVHGYSGGTAQRLAINNSRDFAGASDGVLPQTHENRLLWQWLCDNFAPEYCLHFHAYLGWRRNADYPYDGLYVVDDPPALLSPQQLAQHRAVIDRIRFETPAYSAHFDITGALTQETLEYQMAQRFDTVSALYEINAGSVGPNEQFQRGPQVLSAFTRALLDDARGE